MERHQKLNLLFICLLALAAYLFGTTVLFRNWDVLPYMATILKLEGNKSIDEIHKTVFQEAEKHIPETQYQKLINPENPYRKTIFENPEHLEEQLPFYQIKPLYVLSTFLSYKIGWNLAYATTFPSLIAYLLISWILFQWLSQIMQKHYALIISLLIIFIPPLNKLSRYASPDGLSNLFLLVSIYFYLVKNSSLWKVNLFLVLAVLTRSDNIIFALAFNTLIYLNELLHKKGQHTSFWLSAIGLSLCYLIPQLYFKPPSWGALFYHTFIRPTGTPVTQPSTLLFADYLAVLTEYLPKIIWNPFLYALTIFSILNVPKTIQNIWGKLEKEQIIFLAIVGTSVVKFLLFPVLWDRMYLSFFLVFAILFVQYLTKHFPKLKVI